ncbi:MAG: PAS domain-containing protein, partial [Bacteroidota bacterium]|nr:PAS domain-containing protein [Bacteroidota bacterium]
MNNKTIPKEAFPKLKSCAQYLLDHHFNEMALENVQFSKKLGLPIYTKLAINNGQDVEIHMNSFLHGFLTTLSNISQESTANIFPQWTGQILYGIAPYQLELSDISLGYSIRKQIFLKFISFYTVEIDEALSIIFELEQLFGRLEAFELQELLKETKEEANGKSFNFEETQELEKINEELKIQLSAIVEIKKALKINEERYKLISENSSDLISTHNNEGVFLHASSSCFSLLGYTPDELVGKSIYDFLHKEDFNNIKDTLQKIWEYKSVSMATFRFRNKKGGYNWFESTGKAIKQNYNNNIAYLQVSSRDITKRKKAEQDLNKERQYLLAVLENVNDCIIACDKDGKISFFNQAARTIHALPEKAISPDQWASYYNLYYEDGTTMMKKEDIPLFRALRGDLVDNVIMVVAPKGGKKRTLLATAKQIITSENRLSGAVVGLHDITEKKEWEQKLIKKEALLAESQSMAHLGSWEWDLEADTIIWSDELKNIFQFSLDNKKNKLSTKPYMDFVHPDYFIEVKEKMNKVIEFKEPFTLEHKILLKDGSTRWVLAKAKLLNLENHNILSGILLDITELKTAEIKVKEDKRLIQNIANASPDLIYVHDLSLNAAIYKSRDISITLGFEPEKINFSDISSFKDLVHQDDWEIKENYDSKVLELPDQEFLETRYRLKDVNKQYRWLLFRSTIFARDESGKPQQIIYIVQEITDKIKSENAVKYREAQLLEAQRLAKAGSFEYDIKKDILTWSPEMYRIFGHQPNLISITYELFENSLHPDDKENVKNAIKESIENFKNFDVEHRIILPDNSLRHITTRGRLFMNKKGEAAKLLGSTMDVSERKHSEEELQRKNLTISNAYQRLESAQKDLHRINSKLEDMVKDRTRQLLKINKELKSKNKELLVINSDLDNFIYTASHDLKSPISNMEGLINLLTSEMKGKLNTTEAEIMKMISISINKFKKTIQDLTEITKVQKEVNEKLEVVSFQNVLNDIKSDINSLILDSGAKIISDFKIKEIPYAVKNLRSIIYNLLTNAIKYRSSDRTLLIELKTELDGHYVVFTIADNGLGVQPEHKEKLFNMFRRFHTHVEGTGIGLY